MEKKILIAIFISVFFLNLFGFSLEKIQDVVFDNDSNELLVNTSDFKVIYGAGKYYIKTRYDQKILEFDKTGKKIREFGGKGRGPGEFGGLLGFGINKNKLIAIDYVLYRITIIDLQTNEIETIPLKVENKYSFNLIFFDNTLFLTGHYAKNMFDPLKELFLLSKYDCSKNSHKFISNYVEISSSFSKNFAKSNKYTKNKVIKSFISTKQPKAVKYNKELIAIDPFLPYFVIFNTQNNKFRTKKINFPKYVNPNKINVLKKYKKLKKHKDNDERIGYADFVYSPVRFAYLKSIKKYSIIYKIPYEQRKDDKEKYLEVIFDKNFNFLYDKKIDEIIDYYWNGKEDMALKFINCEGDRTFFELYKIGD